MSATTFEEDLFRDPTLPADRGRAMLADLFGSGVSDAAIKAYRAIRSWVWNALGARVRHDLDEWHDIIRTTSSRLEQTDPDLALKTRAFGELVFTSINHWEANPTEDVLRREHVQEILEMLDAAPDRMLRRRTIRDHLRISDPNMSRVLSLMAQAGLIEREQRGKAVMVRRATTEAATQPSATSVAADHVTPDLQSDHEETSGLAARSPLQLRRSTG